MEKTLRELTTVKVAELPVGGAHAFYGNEDIFAFSGADEGHNTGAIIVSIPPVIADRIANLCEAMGKFYGSFEHSSRDLPRLTIPAFNYGISPILLGGTDIDWVESCYLSNPETISHMRRQAYEVETSDESLLRISEKGVRLIAVEADTGAEIQVEITIGDLRELAKMESIPTPDATDQECCLIPA